MSLLNSFFTWNHHVSDSSNNIHCVGVKGHYSNVRYFILVLHKVQMVY